MTIAARLNSRITQLAVGRHLPHRAVRIRLTLLYGALFLLSGAALMAISYALLINAGFVFTLQNGPANGPTPATGLSAGSVYRTVPPGGLPGPGLTTHPSAQTMARSMGVAQCMRRRGVAGFPNPTTSFPSASPYIGVVSDHGGAIFAVPHTINMQSSAFTRAAIKCGFMDDNNVVQTNRRRTQVRQGLLIQSGIALAGMSLLSLGLGWLMAGRVLQPL